MFETLWAPCQADSIDCWSSVRAVRCTGRHWPNRGIRGTKPADKTVMRGQQVHGGGHAGSRPAPSRRAAAREQPSPRVTSGGILDVGRSDAVGAPP
jgi:hypothetical protein